jgi:hypothetical protein
MEPKVKEQNGKTHWKKVFNSDYLGSCDLEDGKDLKAVIKSVSVQKVKGTDGSEKECNVAIFTDPALKPMILNATNCKVMKKFTKTPFINDWNKVPVQIYVKDDIKAFGEITEGLRIRPTQPKMDKPVLKPGIPAWAKAIEFLSKEGTIDKIREKYDLSETDEIVLKEAVL